MITARILWPPYPYTAGFCITDDTDDADMESVRIVYDLLEQKGIFATKTVWAFAPSEPCGIPSTPDSTLRGITLEDPEYLQYCKWLASAGFEIALHGASAGNNKRASTIRAFELLEEQFGNTGTYICHAKNADNIYWEEKTAPNWLFRKALQLYSRHKCYGEVEGNDYFWGDICREKVRQIRLFRTRNTNTLAANPCMPYHIPTKPYVQNWFSATKRSFYDCTTYKALDKLRRENGLTVLYQYMHRYADRATGSVQKKFGGAVERLANADDILKAPTSIIMDRLRGIQSLFVLWQGNTFWLVNVNNGDLNDLQIECSQPVHIQSPDNAATSHGKTIHVSTIPGNSIVRINTSSPIKFTGKRSARLPVSGCATFHLGLGKCTVAINLAPDSDSITSPSPHGTYTLSFPPALNTLRPMSHAGWIEQTRLFYAQMAIILREHLLKGRSLSFNKFLGNEEILLEDHNSW